MDRDAVFQMLSRSGERTLETMFFTMPDSISSDVQRPTGALVATSLTFVGSPPGRFGLILSEPVGRAMRSRVGALPGTLLFTTTTLQLS